MTLHRSSPPAGQGKADAASEQDEAFLPDSVLAPGRRKRAKVEGSVDGDGFSSSHGDFSLRSSASSSCRNLLWFDELPKELQYNKYVRSGYRAGLSKTQCLCSMFQLHNETGNIYTHLLPALTLLALLFMHALPVWEHAKWAFYESVIPTVICLSASVLYHALMANHRHYRKYLLIDVCGVFLVLVCGATTGMHWGLQCYPTVRTAFIAAYYVSAACCVVSGLKARSQIGRVAPMLALLLIRGGAVIARFVLGTGSPLACYHYMVMEVSGIAGALINVARVPEKWLFAKGGPDARCREAGRFDYWLNSHQLMHILVVLAMLHKYLGTAAEYRHRHVDRVGC